MLTGIEREAASIGPRTVSRAALRYAPAVSRRTPVARSMRRSVQPSRPSARTSFLLSSLKMLVMLARGTTAPLAASTS